MQLVEVPIGLLRKCVRKRIPNGRQQYSRDLETEADTDGFVLMQQNNIDPKGMLDLLKLLKKESAGMPEMMKYLSTHPETDKRIKNVEFLLNS